MYNILPINVFVKFNPSPPTMNKDTHLTLVVLCALTTGFGRKHVHVLVGGCICLSSQMYACVFMCA